MGIWFCYRYSLQKPRESLSPQLVFLAFYRCEFLHCLLPMAEVLKWIRNILLILTLSMTAATDTSVIPRRNMIIVRAVIYIMTFFWFITPVGINIADIGLCITCITACTATASRINGQSRRESTIPLQATGHQSCTAAEHNASAGRYGK